MTFIIAQPIPLGSFFLFKEWIYTSCEWFHTSFIFSFFVVFEKKYSITVYHPPFVGEYGFIDKYPTKLDYIPNF